MKTIYNILKLALILTAFVSTAQNKATRSLIEDIANDYTFENNNIVYEKIYEFSGKTSDELFNSGLDFLENFTESQIQIISNSPNRGKIKAWGFHKDYNNENSWGIDWTISASYNIAIDIKEGRTRLRIIAVDYFRKEDGSGLGSALTSLAGSTTDYNLSSALYTAGSDVSKTIEGDLKVKDVYPFNTYSKNKNIWGRSFYYLNNHIIKVMEAFESYMRSNVNDKW